MQVDATRRHSNVAIERVVAGGEGLGRLPDGRVVFVKGGIPGDVVTVEQQKLITHLQSEARSREMVTGQVCE